MSKIQKADFLANIGSSASGAGEIHITLLYGSNKANNLMIVTLAEVADWRMSIIQYLSGVKLPTEKNKQL